MDLASQIAANNNPQEHTRLCVALYEAEYKSDYQAIDDNRADDGNDGYIISEKRMIARHCFKVRPKAALDSAVLKKLTSDLKKAIELKADGTYDIEKWTFQTNYQVSNSVVKEAVKLGKAAGIQVTIKTETYLADILTRHKHVLSQFSQFQIPEVLPKLDEMNEKLDAILEGDNVKHSSTSEKLEPVQTENPQKPHLVQEALEEDADYKRVIAIIKSGISESAKTSLRAMAYTSTSPLAKMQATFALADWFDVITDKAEQIVELCNSSIFTARQRGRPKELAALSAIKAQYVSQQYGVLYIERFGYILLYNQFGELGGLSSDDIHKFDARLAVLDEQRIEAAKEALQLVSEIGSYEVAGQVLLRVGSSLAGIASTQRRAGDIENGARNFDAGKGMILEAIRCFGEAKEEQAAVYAKHQFANQIRDYGNEKDLALAIEREVLEWAKNNNDQRLQTQATQMIHTIETGEIPDYASQIREQAGRREV